MDEGNITHLWSIINKLQQELLLTNGENSFKLTFQSLFVEIFENALQVRIYQYKRPVMC